MLILLLGGAGSGKSSAAESLAARLPAPVTYVATLVADESDADMMRRIELHRHRRPGSWATVDASAALPDQLRTVAGTILLDSVGAWVARNEPGDDVVEELVGVLEQRSGDSIVVSDEVGMSVHPPSETGRAFRDAIGAVNQRLAAAADHTFVVVAGRVLMTAPFDVDAIVGGAG